MDLFALAETETADFTMMLEQDYMDLAKGCSTVVHSAGIAHRPNAPYQEYEVVNVRATQQVAEAARDAKVHTLVFISSSAVYGPGPFSLVPETETVNAHSPYAVSKATSEKFLSTLEIDIPFGGAGVLCPRERMCRTYFGADTAGTMK